MPAGSRLLGLCGDSAHETPADEALWNPEEKGSIRGRGPAWGDRVDAGGGGQVEMTRISAFAELAPTPAEASVTNVDNNAPRQDIRGLDRSGLIAPQSKTRRARHKQNKTHPPLRSGDIAIWSSCSDSVLLPPLLKTKHLSTTLSGLLIQSGWHHEHNGLPFYPRGTSNGKPSTFESEFQASTTMRHGGG